MVNSEYTHKELESFVRGFRRVSDTVKMEKPDYIFAPVVGAVPFIDILAIVDRHFPLDSVEYLPNSSRFANRDELMGRWYANFYERNEIGDPMKIVCLDEVLSGSSAVKGYKQFRRSIEDRARARAEGLSDGSSAVRQYQKKLENDVNYKIIGVQEAGHKTCVAFNRLVKKGVVHPVNFDKVFTIDNVYLNAIRLRPGEMKANGRMSYLPEIERFDVTSDYMELLRNIARCAGVDPSTVNPVNFSKIEQGLRQSTK